MIILGKGKNVRYMNAVSKCSEFRTDCFTAGLGYDQELKFFLERFAVKTENGNFL